MRGGSEDRLNRHRSTRASGLSTTGLPASTAACAWSSRSSVASRSGRLEAARLPLTSGPLARLSTEPGKLVELARRIELVKEQVAAMEAGLQELVDEFIREVHTR